MELKVGMYVRTDLGEIGKVTSVANDDVFGTGETTFCNTDPYLKGNIQNANFDIINLIEEGDYVNGYRVLEICTGNFELNNPRNVKALKLESIKEDINPNIPFFKRYNFITNYEIKTVLTKEQMEAIEYVIE